MPQLTDACPRFSSAGWIHGIDGNPVAELARKHGADLYDVPSDTVIHGPDGVPVPQEDDESVEQVFNSLLRRAQDEASQSVDDESLGKLAKDSLANFSSRFNLILISGPSQEG